MRQTTVFRAKKHAALETMKGALAQLSLSDALDITSQLLADLAAAKPAQGKRPNIEPSLSVLQVRKAGRKHSIEEDAALEAFILSLKGPRTIEDIRQACVDRFGEKRAPSKSALHRYVQKLQYRGTDASYSTEGK